MNKGVIYLVLVLILMVDIVKQEYQMPATLQCIQSTYFSFTIIFMTEMGTAEILFISADLGDAYGGKYI